MLKNSRKYSGNASACSLCCSCDNVCPVKIDLSTQIYLWRQKLDGIGRAAPTKKYISMGLKYLFNRPGLYNTALKFAPLANYVPNFILRNKLNEWSQGHDMMVFPKESFQSMFKKGKVK